MVETGSRSVGTFGGVDTKFDRPESIDGLVGHVVSHMGDGVSRVDAVEPGAREARVYVEHDVIQHNSPPRELNEVMLGLGYAYMSWAVNGKTGDSRAIFVYRNIDSDEEQMTVGSVSTA